MLLTALGYEGLETLSSRGEELASLDRRWDSSTLLSEMHYVRPEPKQTGSMKQLAQKRRTRAERSVRNQALNEVGLG